MKKFAVIEDYMLSGDQFLLKAFFACVIIACFLVQSFSCCFYVVS